MRPLTPSLSTVGHDELMERVCIRAGKLPPLRSIMVVGHPGDEAAGAASRLVPLSPLAVVYATSGSPGDGEDARRHDFATTEDYARARRLETFAALAHAGISSERIAFLDYMDQRAAESLVELTYDVCDWIRATRPDVVLTHAYEGGHPDHDAVAFAVHHAVAALAHDSQPPPVIVEFASYHSRAGSAVFGEFVPSEQLRERTLELTDSEQAFKRRLMSCYRTQADRARQVAFEKERFRLAPHYDFTEPPASDAALYEQYPWNITVTRWCELARVARAQLATDGVLSP